MKTQTHTLHLFKETFLIQALKYPFLLPLLVISSFAYGQNHTAKWCFGNKAGLDFMTTPPSVFTHTMYSYIGTASIADANGNLLFYTKGDTVFNQFHAVMANGTGLNGNFFSITPALIVKKPGSTNLYYIFTTQGSSGPAGLSYSVVDMLLAGGTGSVTLKNVPLYPSGISNAINGTRHCNGVDQWIVIRDLQNSVFKSYLLTATGISTVAVTSSVTSPGSISLPQAHLKISPKRKKAGLGQ